jgi:hypothetical protein
MRNAYDCLKFSVLLSTCGLIIFLILYAPVSIMITIASYRPEYLEPRVMFVSMVTARQSNRGAATTISSRYATTINGVLVHEQTKRAHAK